MRITLAQGERLCGHVSIRTAHTQYERAKVGHERKTIVRAVLSPDLAREAKACQATRPAPRAEGAMDANGGRAEVAGLFSTSTTCPCRCPCAAKGLNRFWPEAVQAAFAPYGGDSDIAGLGERRRRSSGVSRLRREASGLNRPVAVARAKADPDLGRSLVLVVGKGRIARQETGSGGNSVLSIRSTPDRVRHKGGIGGDDR